MLISKHPSFEMGTNKLRNQPTLFKIVAVEEMKKISNENNNERNPTEKKSETLRKPWILSNRQACFMPL